MRCALWPAARDDVCGDKGSRDGWSETLIFARQIVALVKMTLRRLKFLNRVSAVNRSKYNGVANLRLGAILSEQ